MYNRGLFPYNNVKNLELKHDIHGRVFVEREGLKGA
jgi:hypothetical protein